MFLDGDTFDFILWHKRLFFEWSYLSFSILFMY